MATKAFSEGVQMRAIRTTVTGPSSRDDVMLERLGKKPILKRSFSFFSILGFSCTILITWEASLFVLLSGLQNGGPSGVIYGYLIIWAGMLSIFATLAELVSMAPTSGGQYHWVSMLAPASCQKFLGYITGWLTLTGWQAIVSSSGYLTGTLIQSLILLTNPDYAGNMQNWHGTLILWGVIVLSYGINTSLSSIFIKFEGLAFTLHVLGFFAVILPLVLLSRHASVEDVFGTFENLGGWSSQGLSFCVGLLGTALAFLGGDGAIHMSEEIRNADVIIPWCLFATLLINGTLGFAMVIATLFCMGDINAAIAENPHYPFMAIFRGAVGSTAGAAVMSGIIIIMTFNALVACHASTSRVLWAFARDRAFPGWRTLKKVNVRTKIPTYSVLATAIIASILSLVNIGDATAFNGIISISVAGVFASYLIATSLLLYRRVTGAIHEPRPDDVVANTIGSHLTWGPWRIRGILGIAINCFTCCFLVFILFFSFWPSYKDVTAQTMNWAVLVTGVVLCFSVFYYLLRARKVYSGPVIEV